MQKKTGDPREAGFFDTFEICFLSIGLHDKERRNLFILPELDCSETQMTCMLFIYDL